MKTVSAVKLNHVPNWFRLRLLKAFGSRDGDTTGYGVLQHAVNTLGRDAWAAGWLDHWGSTVLANGKVAFVSEPYMTWPPSHEAMRIPYRIAKETNCDVLVTQDSEWKQPHTIRLVFVPR